MNEIPDEPTSCEPTSCEPTRPGHLLRNKSVFCWAMYDWANSAYTTLLITVLIAYIQRIVFPSDSWGHVGMVVWAWGISLSMLLGALLSPIVGAVADARQSKRFLLGVTALSGALASILLGVVPPEMYILVVGLFVFANLMLELSLGIYDGFLPEIVDEKDVNSASAWGYGLGYLGGGIALVLAIVLMRFGDQIGLSSMASRLRCCLILMGAWWGCFTLPAIMVLRDKPSPTTEVTNLGVAIRASFREVIATLRSLRTNVALGLFLLSFLFYNDGVQTIISQASTFALQELSFPEGELMMVILMIQFLALPGALFIGWIAGFMGQKRTLLVCLAVWGGVLIAALFVFSKIGFWILAAVIAFVLGGTQSVSRSLMATMIPADQNAQYFGFFHLSGKATSFLGTFLFGVIVAATGSSRFAIFGLLPLFLMGAVLLWKVNAGSRVRKPRLSCMIGTSFAVFDDAEAKKTRLSRQPGAISDEIFPIMLMHVCLRVIRLRSRIRNRGKALRCRTEMQSEANKTFAQLQCNACHTVHGMEFEKPETSEEKMIALGGEMPKVVTYGDLVTSIINPSHRFAFGYAKDDIETDGKSKMRIYNDEMTITQLADLVTFLQPHYKVEAYQPSPYMPYY